MNPSIGHKTDSNIPENQEVNNHKRIIDILGTKNARIKSTTIMAAPGK